MWGTIFGDKFTKFNGVYEYMAAIWASSDYYSEVTQKRSSHTGIKWPITIGPDQSRGRQAAVFHPNGCGTLVFLEKIRAVQFLPLPVASCGPNGLSLLAGHKRLSDVPLIFLANHTHSVVANAMLIYMHS
jgi:hypothetical protein